MKRNEVERHAPEARTDTNLPLDESMLDSFTASDPATLVKGSDLRDLIAQSRAALTLRARVAECVRAAAAVTGTDAEMCATEAGADTNHGVVLAALDWQAKRVAELESKLAATQVTAHVHGERWEAAQKHVAELEDANADLRNDNEHFRKQAWERVLEANAMRDALEDVLHNAECACCEDGEPTCCDVCAARYVDARAALAAHPAASLAAYRKSVLEEACIPILHKMADLMDAQRAEELHSLFYDELQLGVIDAEHDVAEIRALAAQAATHSVPGGTSEVKP